MDEQIRRYDGTAIRITYDRVRCIHAAECVRGLPQVFDAERRPWIDPSRASADEIAAVVSRCPTGALAYERRDGAPAEAPETNRISVSADGPLFLRGRILLRMGDGTAAEEQRVALCRCGASAHKPLCDGRHHSTGFADAGVVAGGGMAGPDPDGPLEVVPQRNGPLIVRGRFTLLDGTGGKRGVFETAAFCRCGSSRSKPFCDGSHGAAGFVTD